MRRIGHLVLGRKCPLWLGHGAADRPISIDPDEFRHLLATLGFGQLIT